MNGALAAASMALSHHLRLCTCHCSGQLSEVLNLVPWGGVSLQFRHLRLFGIQGLAGIGRFRCRSSWCGCPPAGTSREGQDRPDGSSAVGLALRAHFRTPTVGRKLWLL